MTDREVIDVLHAAPRGRKRRVFWSWAAAGLAIALLSLAPGLWSSDGSWSMTLLRCSSWVVLGLGCGWVFSAGESLSAAVACVEACLDPGSLGRS